MTVKSVSVPLNDYWILLLSTIRYSMGRSTYMPSLVSDMMRNVGLKKLDRRMVEQIRDEVSRELEARESVGRTLGWGCDHQTWRQLVDDLDEWLKEP